MKTPLILSLAALLSAPTLSQEPIKRPTELLCTGQLINGDGERLGNAKLSLIVDLEGEEVIVAGAPNFLSYVYPLRTEPHILYSTSIPGTRFLLDRSRLEVILEQEGLRFEGQCSHDYGKLL